MDEPTILIFDDKDCEELEEALRTACGSFHPRILCSIDVDVEPQPFSEIRKRPPQPLVDSTIANAAAIIVDLQMGFKFEPRDEEARLDQDSNYQGIYLVRLAETLDTKVIGGCLGKVFVNSGYVSGLRSNIQTTVRAHSVIARSLTSGVSVYQKQPPAYPDLCAKMYSLLDLRSRGYSADRATREALYLIARRAAAPKIEGVKMEPVLILGSSGTGKEGAAEHIHEVGQLFIGNETRPPLKVVHCGALGEDRLMARSELFGHVRGAYTSAGGPAPGGILEAVGWSQTSGGSGTPPDSTFDEMHHDAAVVAKSPQALSEPLRQLRANLKLMLSRGQSEDAVAKVSESVAEFATGLVNEAERLETAIERLHQRYRRIDTETQAVAGGTNRISSAEYRDWLLAARIRRGTKEIPLFVHDLGAFDLRISEHAPFGTVFFDEFGTLPPGMQALLLRFVENGELEPLGYVGKIRLVDNLNRLHVRFIAATNEPQIRDLLTRPDLESIGLSWRPPKIDASFRADLVYRLARWVVELDDVRPEEIGSEAGEEGALLRSARRKMRAPERLRWEPAAVQFLRRAAEVQGFFGGNRREIDVIASRANALAWEQAAMGLPEAFAPFRVTEEIIRRALYPVRLRPVALAPISEISKDASPLATGPVGERGPMSKLLRRCIHQNFDDWKDCPENVDWEMVKTKWVSDKPRIVRLIILSAAYAKAEIGPLNAKQLQERVWNVSEGAFHGYLGGKSGKQLMHSTLKDLLGALSGVNIPEMTSCTVGTVIKFIQDTFPVAQPTADTATV